MTSSSPPKKKLRGDKSTPTRTEMQSPSYSNDITACCPNCQMPFSALSRVQTPTWHLSECLETDRKGQRECSMGIECDCTIVSHYLKFTHYRLAARRSGVEQEQDEVIVSTTQVPDVFSRPPINLRASLSQSPSKTVAGSAGQAKRWRNNAKNKNGDSKQAKITSFFLTKSNNIVTRNNRMDVDGEVTDVVSKPDSIIIDFPKVAPVRPPPVALNVLRPWTTRASGADHGQLINGPSRRQCPKYKKIVDVPFVVDAFSYGDIPGITAYFLSHFHSDHYVGLTNKFRKNIYCSQVTANLVKLKFKSIPTVCLHVLPLNEHSLVNGVEVILIEANHCPGAVMFLFRFSDGRTVLHTGDFRADVAMEQHPALSSPSLNVDYLYLDTTYCQPLYDFPTQSEVLKFVVNVARKHMMEDCRTLIVCGSYTIGKEKVFTAIAEALDLKVWTTPTKKGILECLEDHLLNRLLTSNVAQAGVHVLAMNELNFQYLEDYLAKASKRFNSVLAFRPTGWEQQRSGSRKTGSKLSATVPQKRGRIAIYGVPYSEHSSFSELHRFVQFVRPATVIPTVNVTGDKSRQQMDIILSWTRKTPFDSVK